MPDNKIDLSDIFSEGYGIVPKKLMLSDLDIETKAILCLMLSYTGAGKTECWPSIRKIAGALKISTTTVQSRIKQIVSGKVIGKRQVKTEKGNIRNIYQLNFLPGAGGVSADDTGVCQEVTQGVSADDTGVCQEVVHNINSINNNNKSNNVIKKAPKRRSPSLPSEEKNKEYLPLAELLYQKTEETSDYMPTCLNLPKKLITWANDIRLMFEQDAKGNLTFELVRGVILWCKDPDNFPGSFSWVPNICSGKKLRMKMDKLLPQYKRWQVEEKQRAEDLARRERLDKARAEGRI